MTRICGLVLVLISGVCVLLVDDVSGQSIANGATPARVGIAMKVAPACRGAVDPDAVREAAAARLAGAGVTVSSVHNARVSIEMDCTAHTPIGRNRAMSVRECLTFSEAAPAPPRAGLTPSWHKCESYTAAAGRDARHPFVAESQLIGEFLSSVPLRPQAAAVHPQGTHSNPPRKSVLPIDTARLIVYGGYILNCVIVLAYWQFRWQRFASE